MTPSQRGRDPLSSAARSALMRRIGPKDSKPELALRRYLHRLGYRFRLHRRDLPGTPDIVFPGRRKAIFVHGCFWHRHPLCPAASMPKSRVDYWSQKFEDNVARDRRNLDGLKAAGWSIMVVWSCETKDLAVLHKRLDSFLGSPGDSRSSERT